MELLANGSGDILFFRDRDGPPVPTLRILHQYPFLLKPQQVDKGAIRFILSGANIMCPGLTSPGANMIDAAESEIVAIYAEGQGVKLRCKKVRCWYRTRTKARLPPRNATTRVNRVERGKGKLITIGPLRFTLEKSQTPKPNSLRRQKSRFGYRKDEVLVGGSTENKQGRRN